MSDLARAVWIIAVSILLLHQVGITHGSGGAPNLWLVLFGGCLLLLVFHRRKPR